MIVLTFFFFSLSSFFSYSCNHSGFVGHQKEYQIKSNLENVFLYKNIQSLLCRKKIPAWKKFEPFD